MIRRNPLIALFLSTVIFPFASHSARAESLPQKRCIVVSDWDDTIKVSHSNSKTDTVIRGLFTERVFAGAPQFLTAVAERCRLYILSDSPTFQERSIRDTIQENGIPAPASLLLRNWFNQPSATFKSIRLEDIFAEVADQGEVQYVFIGDDTLNDARIYASFIAHHPEIAARSRTYVHQIRQMGTFDSSQRGFTIYPEITRSLAPLLGFSSEEMDRVKQAVLEAPMEEVIPSYAACPAAPLSAILGDKQLVARLRTRCPDSGSLRSRH